MRSINSILIWENQRRIAALTAFRSNVEAFGDAVEYPSTGRRETEASVPIRAAINREIQHINQVILGARVSTKFTFSSLTARGDINVVQNIFHLGDFQIGPEVVVDAIDQAIGAYEHNRRPALVRTLNPFFYVMAALEWVASLPFRFLARLGLLDRERAESSPVGRGVKGVLEVITAVASVIAILQAVGII